MPDKIKLVNDPLPYEVAEELNTLRTNLLFSGDDIKVVMVTSCVENEGKSTIALNLAISLTEIGKKVIFLDCDLRKSVISHHAVMPPKWYGLTHFLTKQCEISSALMTTDIPNLFTILAGPVSPNPTKLLSSASFKSMLKALRATADYVIVDTPPLGMVVDAAIIAQHSDAAILVLQSGQDKRALVHEVQEKLERTGCPILGVVLNGVNRSKNGYYYSKKYQSGYYKKYDHYYKSEDKK